jgi:hypothetical protein
MESLNAWIEFDASTARWKTSNPIVATFGSSTSDDVRLTQMGYPNDRRRFVNWFLKIKAPDEVLRD